MNVNWKCVCTLSATSPAKGINGYICCWYMFRELIYTDLFTLLDWTLPLQTNNYFYFSLQKIIFAYFFVCIEVIICCNFWFELIKFIASFPPKIIIALFVTHLHLTYFPSNLMRSIAPIFKSMLSFLYLIPQQYSFGQISYPCPSRKTICRCLKHTSLVNHF